MKRRLKRKRQPVKRARKRVFVRSGDFSVYILKCCDGSYYTGHTNDLAARIKLHRSGKGARYVRSHLPFRLVYTKKYRYFKAAFAEEFRVKALPRAGKDILVKQYRLDQRKARGLHAKK